MLAGPLWLSMCRLLACSSPLLATFHLKNLYLSILNLNVYWFSECQNLEGSEEHKHIDSP